MFRCREVARWAPLDPAQLQVEGRIIYDSADKDDRRPVLDLGALPLTDDLGNETSIYDQDGYRIPRRVPQHRPSTSRCGILMDLTKVHTLFQTPAQRAADAEDEDEPFSDADIINEDEDHEKITLAVYPQGFTKHFGHFQSKTNVPYGFKPLLRSMNRTLADNADDDRPVVRGVALQGYNALQHNLTQRAGRLEVVQGQITATMAGTRAKGTKALRTFAKLRDMTAAHLPHERVEEKLLKDNISRGFRFEIVVSVDLGALKPGLRRGG
jgi:hypothetical protein